MRGAPVGLPCLALLAAAALAVASEVGDLGGSPESPGVAVLAADQRPAVPVGPEVDPVEAELGEGAIAKLAAGEARGGGRRGGFLSTSGSFTLSSGADSNTAGNEELGEGDSDLNRQGNPLGTTEVAKIMALATAAASHGLGERESAAGRAAH